MQYIKIFCYCFVIICLNSQAVDFYKEKIEMNVSENYFEITGTYYFANKDNQEFSYSIFYPFIVDDAILFPDSIYAAFLDGREMQFIKRENGISFPLTISANDTLVYKIYFRQKINSKKAEYILTTTKMWNKPFEDAQYIITTPRHFDVEYIYPKPDSIEKRKDSILYKSEKHNYLPDENLKILWR